MFSAFLEGMSKAIDISGTRRTDHKQRLANIRARIDDIKQRIKKEYRN